MNIGELYKIVVEEGIKQDPRSREKILRYLQSVREEYNRLSPPEKTAFDKEKFTNPYSDTRLLYGSPKTSVHTIMVGVDIETPELLLADRLKKSGKNIDLVIAHHPEGYARADFYRVMNVLHDIFKEAGLRGLKFKKMLDERINEVMRKTISGNCTQAVDAARLLDMPFMCAHTVCDNFAYQYFYNIIKKQKPQKVSDILDLLYGIPEYKIAMKNNLGPRVILGKPSNKCGKVMIEMTGGTEGPKNIYKELVRKKVKTFICMHVSEEHFKKAKKHDINIIIAGHISSDTLGINLLLDKVEKHKKLNIISCSGFTRIRRKGSAPSVYNI